MADIFNFYVLDNRRINFEIAEPIMREDKGVTDWVFHIPKILNGIDMSAWAWWLVYTNAKGQKRKEALILSDDPESPLDSSVGTYTVDYGMSIKAGSVQFALESVSAVAPGGEISGEWHTLTYKTTVKETLQGSEVEIEESQSDIISALIQQIQNKYNALVGGATPLPVNLKSLMTDHDKVYLYTGSETGESTGYWYCWNGTAWAPGGQYGAGIQIDPTLSQSGQAADAKVVGDKIGNIENLNTDNKSSLVSAINEVNEHFLDGIEDAVGDWLNDHPEATTTIADGEVITAKLADGAVTEAKLEQSLKQKIFTPYLFVPYLDAEQTLSGHCFAFVYKNHCTLIDLGPYVSFDTLKAQLINRGIDTVDNIIITHWHYDHDGFMEGYSGNIANAYNHWKNAFDMTNTVFYIPRDTPTGFDGSGGYNAIVASFASNTKNILSNSTVFEWNDVVFSVKNQGDDDYAYYSTLGSSDLNYCSAIVYAEYKDVVFLDSGDILATSQERCVNEGYVKHADIVSIPHHGVSGAGYAGFMETVKPLYAYVPDSYHGSQYGLQDPNIGIAGLTATIFENVNNQNGVVFDISDGVSAIGSPSVTTGRALSGKRMLYVDESISQTDYQDGTEQHPFRSITTACGHLEESTEINLLSDIETTTYISGVQGVVIINGNGHQIGGVNIGNGAHVQINDVKTKSDYGIFINDSYVKMEDCTITTPCKISRSDVHAFRTILDDSEFASDCFDSKVTIATISGTTPTYVVSNGTRSSFNVTGNTTGKGINATYSSVVNTSKGYETDDYLSFNPSNRTVTDLNNAPFGLVYIGSGVTNAPESYCMVLTLGVNNYVQQMAFPLSGTPTKFYVRKRSSAGNWVAWIQVATT